jgi:3-oxoacyl-[acyl-carrier protein] reductase
MIDFQGQVLVLTGAAGGIGRAIARRFLDAGARVVLSDVDGAALTELAGDLDPAGERVLEGVHDVGDARAAEGLAERCRACFGGADFLVTGAGLYRDQAVQGMSDAQWAETLRINLDGVFYTCRALIPLLRDGGAIVNLSSMAGHRGSRHHAHYSAAKGAVLSFSRSLALELAPRIRVNAVSPGLIDTSMVQPLLAAQGERLLEATPLKRLGSADEVAGVVAFLCSDLASFVVGETVQVNGGLYMA